MLRYAITDGAAYGGDRGYRLNPLVDDAARWREVGIDFIQLREKDLQAGELADLTRRVITAVRASGAGKDPRAGELAGGCGGGGWGQMGCI